MRRTPPDARLALRRHRRRSSTAKSAGATLGYPTANMRLDPASELKHGIYAVRLPARRRRSTTASRASAAARPSSGGAPLLETFVFDFAGDLYGEEVLVAFYGFIRPERKFENIAELVARMDQDSLDARADPGAHAARGAGPEALPNDRRSLNSPAICRVCQKSANHRFRSRGMRTARCRGQLSSLRVSFLT